MDSYAAALTKAFHQTGRRHRIAYSLLAYLKAEWKCLHQSSCTLTLRKETTHSVDRAPTFLRRRVWRAMRSAWGVDTLTLATTESAARRAGTGEGTEIQGRGTKRLPDTDAEKEWAPASAGEANMAYCATLLLACFLRLARYGVLGITLSYPLCSV